MKNRIYLLLPIFIFMGILALAGMSTAHAYPVNQCAADRYGSDLNCTAGDVQITGMRVTGDTSSCVGGTDITLDLELTVNFATPDRWDIGIFISNDGKNPETKFANGGAETCSVSVLPTASPFLNLDGGATGDTCGDGSGDIGGGTGSGIHYMTNVTVPCQSLAGASGKLYIPFVVSWDNQKTPPGNVCNSNDDPVPNTSSKCNAPTILQGSIEVAVLPDITKTDGKTTMFPGDVTDYDITITNTTGATLSNVVFKDPAVSGITVSNVTCSPAGGASCPASSTVAAMQGAGITIPAMPVDASVTFTVTATLAGNPSDTRTNTATVTVGSQTNTASDTNTLVDTIAILPTSQSLTGDKGAAVIYTYAVWNYGDSTDTISLSVASNKSWTVTRNPTSVTLAPGASANVTVTVNIPGGAATGTVDTTTITAVSGNNPSKTATATAITTVTDTLTLTPSNTAAGGAGSSVYYSHRVQNNASGSSKSVSLTPVFSGCTGTWVSALYESDKTTALISPVTLAGNGDYKDFVLKVTIPVGAAASSTCTATLTAAYTPGGANAVSVTDVTTVKSLMLYEDPGYITEQSTYPAGNNVYAKTYGLTPGANYYYRYLDPAGNVICADPASGSTPNVGGMWTSFCAIPASGPLGTWTVQVWRDLATDTKFAETNFYVGPDHVAASYAGASVPLNTNVTVDLALHDRTNHVVPMDANGNLVKGGPTEIEGPLMITVTVSGSAEIVSTTLLNATIVGQTVTGKLDATTGTATLTMRDSVAETVTVTPASYKAVLYGSTARDEPTTVEFEGVFLNHYELSLPTSAVACLPVTATVTACQDSSSPCTNPVTTISEQTATLSTNAGALGSTTVTFNASGVASTTLSYPAAIDGAIAKVTLSDVQTVASGLHQCCQGGICAAIDNCSTTFNTAGFVFSTSAGGVVATIPTQLAGVSDATYYLRAVKTNTTTQACESALTGANTVNFAYECNDPASCYAANLMSVNGSVAGDGGWGAATTIARNDNGSVASYTSVNMTFDANGNAPFTFRYSDVGQVKLYASKTAGGALVSTLTGSSNAFVVAPHHFGLSGVTAGPIKAGNNFSATVTAYNGLATPTATPSFGKESVAESATITFAKCQPTGTNAVNGTFSGSLGSFNDGVASAANLNWDEVGNGDLIATLSTSPTHSSYLGSGLVVTGNTGTGGTACNGAGNVGAFIPDHFITTVTDGCAGCGFTYSGQPFSVTVTAMNGLPIPAETFNYDGTANTSPNFANDVTLSDANAVAAPVGVLGVSASPMGVAVNAVIPATTPPSTVLIVPQVDFIQGEAVLTGVPAYTFNTSLMAPTTIRIRAVDEVNATVTSSGFAEGTTEIRSGRVKIANAHGSELLPLPMTATVQFYNGTFWTTSVTDSVTSLTLAATYNVIDKLGATTGTTTPTPSGAASVTSGLLNFKLSKPTGGAGSATINPSTPAWLPLTPGLATFGVFKGNNEFIYLRENY